MLRGSNFTTLPRIQVMQIWTGKIGGWTPSWRRFFRARNLNLWKGGPLDHRSRYWVFTMSNPTSGRSNISYQHQRPMISPDSRLCLTALKSIPSKNWAQLSQQKPFTQPNFPTRAQGARHPLHSTHCSLMFFESHHSLGVHPACMHWNCHLLSEAL